MTRLRSIAMSALVALAAGAPAGAADVDHPVVVELFQSQGCSSCPPANANLNAIAGRDDVLALSFAVTYWDELGWKDTFAQPRFTERQRDYAQASGRGQVFTPQMIVNGRGVLIGRRPDEVAEFIRRFDRGSSGPTVTATADGVTIGAVEASSAATVWLVRYDPRTRNVPIGAGENGGRTLPHRNIVHALERLGQWTGARASFAIAASPEPDWRSAVIVQQGRGGPIIAAQKIGQPRAGALP